MIARVSYLSQRMSQITHSIRFRLVLWFVVILAIVMGAFSGFIYWRQAQDVRSIATSRLNYAVEHLVGSAEENEHSPGLLTSGSSAFIFSNPGSITDLQAIEIVAVRALDGTILQNNGVLTDEQIQQLDLPVKGWSGVQMVSVPRIPTMEGNRYLFANPAILQNGQVAGYLLVGVPLDANNQLGRLQLTLALGNLLTLAVAITGGFWLADRAMRPVRTITQTAKEISETDLHKRLRMTGKDELSQLGNTFDAMLDRLQGAFERQRQFTADASHELRTPLTIIDLEASRGLAARRSVEEYERILHNVKAENQFMTRLVTNLLALARMDAGQVSLKADLLDLSELVSEVIERLEPLAASQGVKLDVRELPELTVNGDRSTLAQMLTNLVENAIKYSVGVKDPLVSISTGQRKQDGQQLAWVQVSDYGMGIAPEHQAQIFDRFYQVDAARSRQEKSDDGGINTGSSGTGLGLAIAQWIAQAHHGEIRVESALGKGSRFEVLLPLASSNGWA